MNENKYQRIFLEAFELPSDTDTEVLEYNTFDAWDSIGHMQLIAMLEAEFDIMMDMDDIIDLSSYVKGKEILGKYGIEF